MKKMRKVLALVLAMAMVFAYGAMVFAGDETEPASGETEAAAQAEPGEFTGGEFSQTVETTITATNLTAGDSIGYIRLIEWDTTTSDWKLTTEGTACGVTLAELLNGITEAEASTIATKVSGNGTAMTVSGTTATATVVPGLYFLRAVSADNNTVYNPAFVSADYYAGGNSVDLATEIGSSTVLKKSSVPFDKEVTGSDQYIDTKPGDIIPYKITTKIPSYGTAFTNPVFTITDTLSAGLTLEGDITVKYGSETTTETVAKVVTITKGTPTNGFTVEFAADYLKGLAGTTPDVEITYSAKVTTEATNNVTYMDNKAKLTFSNKPGETSDKEDITRHYTFSIDANMNGGNHGNEKTRELIKIGVDEQGQTITDFTSWVEGEEWTEYTPLAGAKFQLVGNGKTYTAESTAEGYISFNGLDAGTYTLTETEAPAGYIRDTEEHTVVITPTYDQENPDVLLSYIVTVDDSTSAYTISNMSDTAATVETTVDATSMTFPFVNTKGNELPSTGGVGTTMFYLIGAILVIGAGVVLVTRRRVSVQ